MHLEVDLSGPGSPTATRSGCCATRRPDQAGPRQGPQVRQPRGDVRRRGHRPDRLRADLQGRRDTASTSTSRARRRGRRGAARPPQVGFDFLEPDPVLDAANGGLGTAGAGPPSLLHVALRRGRAAAPEPARAARVRAHRRGAARVERSRRSVRGCSTSAAGRASTRSWLAEEGYEVVLIDLVAEHVEQAAALPGVSASLGDARALAYDDARVHDRVLSHAFRARGRAARPRVARRRGVRRRRSPSVVRVGAWVGVRCLSCRMRYSANTRPRTRVIDPTSATARCVLRSP